MLSYLPTLLLVITFSVWIWVSVILFRIHNIGVEVFFNTRYKSTQTKKTAELRKDFRAYLTFLWIIEVLSSFGVVVFSALLICTPR